MKSIIDDLLKKVPGICGVCEKLDGSYAFVVMSSKEKEKVAAAMGEIPHTIEVNYSDIEYTRLFEKPKK